MLPEPVLRPWWERLLLGLVGALLAIAVYGTYPLDPTHIDWMVGDNAQHYLGWDFFRYEPWQLPLGHISRMPVHSGTSLIFTDALPLVALPLRLIAPLLPEPFQFHGWWMVACYALQAICGAALLQACGVRSLWARLCGATLFCLAPWFSGHVSIMGQWQLLAALALYAADVRLGRMRIARWTALCVLALFTHFYLWWMVATVAAAAAGREAWQRKRWQSFARYSGIILGASAAAILLLGYLGGEDPAGAGYGIYSTNLDSFFDSGGGSRWLPALAKGLGQYEGYGYFGVAGLALLVLAVVLHLRTARAQRAQWLPLWIAVLYLYCLAVSTTVMWGSHLVLQLPKGGGLFFGTIRSSGRFVFLVCDALFAFALVTIAKQWPRAAAAIFSIAIALQAYELTPFYRAHHVEPSPQFARLRAPVWQTAPQDYDHIALYPPLFVPVRCIGSIEPGDEDKLAFYAFGTLAAEHGMTINSAYLARRDKVRERQYCTSFIAQVDAGELAPRTFYVIDPKYRERFMAHMPVDCGHIDGREICTAKTDTSALHAALSAR